MKTRKKAALHPLISPAPSPEHTLGTRNTLRLLSLLFLLLPQLSASAGTFNKITTISLVEIHPTTSCGSEISLIDQSFAEKPSSPFGPYGYQSEMILPDECFANRYGVTSFLNFSSYLEDGSSFLETETTGSNGTGPTLTTPAEAPLQIPLGSWEIETPSGYYKGQSTTVAIIPMADTGESPATQALFLFRVEAYGENGVPIPPNNITVAGQQCDSTGTAYVSFPLDGMTRQVTPVISSANNYSFNFEVGMVQLRIAAEVGNSSVSTIPTPAWVSDRIHLTASLAPNPTGLTIDAGSHTWDVGGTIVAGFDPGGQTESGGPISWSDPKTPTTTFTWVTGGSPETYLVEAQAKVNGKTLRSSRAFNVNRPTVTFSPLFPCTDDPNFLTRNGRLGFGLVGNCPDHPPLLGYPPSAPTPGFFVSQNITAPLFWVQTGASLLRVEWRIPNMPHGGWELEMAGLDAQFGEAIGAHNTLFMDDTTWNICRYGQVSAQARTIRADDFKTYLMINRSGIDFAVPLGFVSWTWSSVADLDPALNQWTLAARFKQIKSHGPSTEFPSWTQRIDPSMFQPPPR